MDGFIDNIRYRSRRRDGWVLSLSTWRDEKALIRRRTHAAHHAIQEKGRQEVFQDYHLSVGQVTADNAIPEGHGLREQRLDETETGAKAVTVVQARRPTHLPGDASAETVAVRLGLLADADGLVGWDLFEAILTPGDLLLLSWRDAAAADRAERRMRVPEGTRLRRVRMVRDYGIFERREAPQYYSPVELLMPSG